MTSLIKGALGYITPGAASPEPPKSDSGSPVEASSSEKFEEDESKKKESPQQPGYLKRAVSGLGSGVYSVGSSTVGAGVSGVKWIAGTTYNVGTGVVGAVGSVAGTAAGVVGSGASVVLSKVTPTKTSKEHND